MPQRIAISIGDYNGIGPEVILKALEHSDSDATPLIVGSTEVIEFYKKRMHIPIPYETISRPEEIVEGIINVYDFNESVPVDVHPGELSPKAGKYAMQSVEKCIELCQNEITGAMVTAPISKEAVNRAGYDIPGHTEFLSEKTDTQDYMMVLVNQDLRVGLVTIHVPLSRVAEQVTETNIIRHIRIMHKSMQDDFGIDRPSIAVLGLNPHAGDGGIIGEEEINVIHPALQKARFNDIDVQGPYPADGFFGNRRYREFDAVLAMYHDQGLIPFKTLSFGAGVNFTAGLPIIRTSPDHGTAFDIAGKNRAEHESFLEAFELAATLAENRYENVKER